MTTETRDARPTSVIVFLAGVWLFISPWLYGAYFAPSAWNSWIIGLIIGLTALTRLNLRQSNGLSWFNLILGIWTFVSPWIFGYTTDMGRFVNSLCVGAIVFVAALVSANAHPTHRAV
ncbi:MAG TPA: SPW repeat protein [Bryobacteraceae bacterium]|nr:SPW repeat protein [Bryobacteraceae bacterium]